MPLPLPATVEENHAAQLNFEAISLVLGNGVSGQVLTADAHGNAAWSGNPAGWTAPTLINSFVNGAPTAAAYRRDALGFIHLRGAIMTGTSGTVAFVLPAGFRPGSTDFWPALQSTGAAGVYVQIDTAGNVTPTYTAATVYLAGITFLAEN